MRRNILLLRHGEVQGEAVYRGHQDDPLSPLGLQQMHASTEGYTWTHMTASPSQRCAAFMHAHSGTTQALDARWQELYFGTWEGQTYAQICAQDRQLIDQFWQDPSRTTPPQGESLASLQQRVMAAWQAACAQPHQTHLIVTHGGPIRIIIAHLTGVPLAQLPTIPVPHACLSHIKLSEHGVILHQHGGSAC